MQTDGNIENHHILWRRLTPEHAVPWLREEEAHVILGQFAKSLSISADGALEHKLLLLLQLQDPLLNLVTHEHTKHNIIRIQDTQSNKRYTI